MTIQTTFPIFDFSEEIKNFANSNDEERGAIFTKQEVVEFILDLSGYTVDQPLNSMRLLEPSFGQGDFLLPATSRLLIAYDRVRTMRSNVIEDLKDAVRAVEIHSNSIQKTIPKLLSLMKDYNVSEVDAHELLKNWIVEGDFLLVDLPHSFSHAIGNPPYVRQESIPNALLSEYRERYVTMYDRADLYIPFIERCLSNLESAGTLGFICPDRWMKNKYGGPLRAMIAKQYHLACYVDMVDTPAFHSEVSAYPAITVIKRAKSGPTRISYRPHVESLYLKKIAHDMLSENIPSDSSVLEVKNVTQGKEPWILQSLAQLELVRRLEAKFPTLETVGCKVGIGVATGADKIFINSFESLDVEPNCKLPLVKTKDIEQGIVKWKGLGVINPFNEDGSLVDLKKHPKLEHYLQTHEEVIRNRNCAKKNPNGWYRTIDRIYPDLKNRPKLLIPDIKSEANIVYEDGQLYPHHNLYYIISDEWDLKALQAVLLSGIAKLFISVYSTQMRGGYLRFQAQYLRRIRLPYWNEVPETIKSSLIEATNSREIGKCDQATFALYELAESDQRLVISAR